MNRFGTRTRVEDDTYPWKFVLKNRSLNTPEPLAGWTFLFQVFANQRPADTDTPDFTSNGTITDALLGKFEIPFDGFALADGQYYYSIKGTDPNGKVHTLEKGRLLIDPTL